jgi:hypothetical protein
MSATFSYRERRPPVVRKTCPYFGTGPAPRPALARGRASGLAQDSVGSFLDLELDLWRDLRRVLRDRCPEEEHAVRS